MNRAHYLRFARALALAAVVPGCTGASGPRPTPDPQLVVEGDAGVATTADGAAHADASVDSDADLPFSSGPIVPPELPESFA